MPSARYDAIDVLSRGYISYQERLSDLANLLFQHTDVKSFD